LEELSNFRGSNPQSFDQQEKTLANLSELIESLGFPVKTSRIASYIRLLAKLRSKAESNLSLTLSDVMEWLHTSIELSQLDIILRAAKDAPTLATWQDHLGVLISGTHPDVISKFSPSWDFQFEALVAGVAQLSGYAVEFEEPDIVVTEGNVCFGIAAKRPRNQNGVRRNIHKAAKQISKTNRDGIIALDCTAILATDRAITTTDDAQATELVNEILERFIRNIGFEIHRAKSESNVIGILLTLYMPATIVDLAWQQAERMTTSFRWTVVPLIEPYDPRHDLVLRFAEKCQRGLFATK
jgi:hypothetical protein